MTRGKSTGSCHNSPPGEAGGRANKVADGARCSRESGLLRYFAVGHNLAGFETQQHRRDLLAEILHGFLIVKS
jgi:hypothetical protein